MLSYSVRRRYCKKCIFLLYGKVLDDETLFEEQPVETIKTTLLSGFSLSTDLAAVKRRNMVTSLIFSFLR